MTTLRKYAAILIPAAALTACGEEVVDLPFGTAQQFMANDVQTTAEVYWDAVGASSELVDGEAVFSEWQPESDEDWENIRLAAVRLGEYGEVMASPAYSDGRGDDWFDFAQGMVNVAERAEQAAVAQDPDAVFEVGGTIYAVCTACHQIYPPADLPAGVTVDDIEADPNRPSIDQSLEEYLNEDSE